jgi:hypothetical protein
VKLPFRGKGTRSRSKPQRGYGLLPSPPAEPDQGLRPRATGRSDQGCPTTDVEMLAFLERWLEGLEPLSGPVPAADLAARALELANPDWSDHDAGEEFARLANHDCQLLKATGRSLVLHALTHPVSDAQAVRIEAILRLAMQSSGVDPTGKNRRRADHDG